MLCSELNIREQKSIPLWGTCDGFENMLTAISKSGESILDSDYNATNVPLKVHWNEETAYNSTLFSVDLSDNKLFANYEHLVLDLFGSGENAYNDHHKGCTSKKFLNDEYVASNFSILGTSIDLNGKEFVSVIESFASLNLNWFATLYHPEKIKF